LLWHATTEKSDKQLIHPEHLPTHGAFEFYDAGWVS